MWALLLYVSKFQPEYFKCRVSTVARAFSGHHRQHSPLTFCFMEQPLHSIFREFNAWQDRQVYIRHK